MNTPLNIDQYNKLSEEFTICSYIINLTDECNLGCKYCFTHPNPRKISLQTMKDIILFAVDNWKKYKEKKILIDGDDTLSFCFFGGEPMLRFKEIIEPIILWVKEEKKDDFSNIPIRFSITTNGTLLTEEVLKFFYEYKCGILLSMDGDKITQDSQRPMKNGKSGFDILDKEVIPNLLKYFPQTTFRSTIEPYNADKLLENYLYARKKGFVNYFVCPNAYAKWDTEAIQTVLQQISAIEAVFYRDLISGIVPLGWSNIDAEFKHFFMEKNNILKPDKETVRGKLKRCGIGTYTVGVSPNGDLKGCQERNTIEGEDIFRIGNIYTGIDKNAHIKLLNNYLQLPHAECRQDKERCKNCSYYWDCFIPHCPSRDYDICGQCGETEEITCIWKDFLRRSAEFLIKQATLDKREKEILENYIFNLFGEEVEI